MSEDLKDIDGITHSVALRNTCETSVIEAFLTGTYVVLEVPVECQPEGDEVVSWGFVRVWKP